MNYIKKKNRELMKTIKSLQDDLKVKNGHQEPMRDDELATGKTQVT